MSNFFKETIKLRGAKQNNLRDIDLDLPLNNLVVVTGVSGAGKSSLVLDTIYAEGQRRYIQSFSPYARQFFERIDRPDIRELKNVLPSIAIEQANPVRTSRSTVGTMTELADYLKLLFSRASRLYCPSCGCLVKDDKPNEIHGFFDRLRNQLSNARLQLFFDVIVPKNFSEGEVRKQLMVQGYSRVSKIKKNRHLSVLQDRFRLNRLNKTRFIEAIETAFRMGKGKIRVEAQDSSGDIIKLWTFSKGLHCGDCDISFKTLSPSSFSFNSPIGACESCKGFGRVIGVDFGLVVPDPTKTLRAGAVKPWQTKSFNRCQKSLEKYAQKQKIPLDIPWSDMEEGHKKWVLHGETAWKSWSESWPGVWYGVKHFFQLLETKAYKMHIRVLLSKYRSYSRCQTCSGSRLKKESLNWRIGKQETSYKGTSRHSSGDEYNKNKLFCGFNIHEIMTLPLNRLDKIFESLEFQDKPDDIIGLLIVEIRKRLFFLQEVGLGYLTLDRQSRSLSGGEMQRVNLTTALGSSLTNTLFVLDEPTVGLHYRDVERLIVIMRKLVNAGNSLLVVDHDPQIILNADQVIELGPASGEEGGDLVFFGGPQDILLSKETETAKYFSGSSLMNLPITGHKFGKEKVRIEEININNLKNLTVEIPLQGFISLTGVSGSGKSSLLMDAVYGAALHYFGKNRGLAKCYRAVSGFEGLSAVIAVDQKPIGKSTRSNPASYVGAFEDLRKIFSKTPDAMRQGMKAGDFSFNAGSGRCSVCLGTGFEHIEMQFLSDVYLKCPGCNGTRYKEEVLEVYVNISDQTKYNISDVLNMTVSEAIKLFKQPASLCRKLKVLREVGLDYVKLGQPVPTLSGGEAQRLKLASHIIKIRKNEPTLFLLDEPTTGLHPSDIAKLVNTIQGLVGNGHSVVVIEHNLDVIRASNWVIELGPDGGEAGGEVVFSGTVENLKNAKQSFTGIALSKTERWGDIADNRKSDNEAISDTKNIRVVNARENNLKHVSVEIPHNKTTVITGVSGSGKSTLAFNIIFGEGQRRYLDCLNAYARQFIQPPSKPDVDAIYGIPPTIAIEQRVSRGGIKSTVATQTEIYHFLRLLFVKLGKQYCPRCGVHVEPRSVDDAITHLFQRHLGCRIGFLAPLVTKRKGQYVEVAEWAWKRGYTHLRLDNKFVPSDNFPVIDRFKEHSIDLPIADIVVNKKNKQVLRDQVEKTLEIGKGVMYFIWPLKTERGEVLYSQQSTFSVNSSCPLCGDGFDDLDPRSFSYNSKYGWCGVCRGTGLDVPDLSDDFDEDQKKSRKKEINLKVICNSCNGNRLNERSLAVKFREYSISDLTDFTVSQLYQFFRKIDFSHREKTIISEIRKEIEMRLNFLIGVGLEYLKLNRPAPSLSGGEAQRIRLAAQLGTDLSGVCYVLDEPTIGLHPRDNKILMGALKRLKELGNTLVVVEHDKDIIAMADHVIDLGPSAGERGGEVIASGQINKIMNSPKSITGKFLKASVASYGKRIRFSDQKEKCIQVQGATANNLKGIDVRFPYEALTVVTGVSGSGKSTLVKEVLFHNMANKLNRASKAKSSIKTEGCNTITGYNKFDRALEVDQSPIGKTPRSCPATYVGIWTVIREVFASAPESRERGYTASRFSFNKKEGCCPQCKGQGYQRVEMSFLSDVVVDCDECNGMRFNPETLEIKFKGLSVGDVLKMSVEEAIVFFEVHAAIRSSLQLLIDVGLGYLRLGQPSYTLSGGEAQRTKLVAELANNVRKGNQNKEREIGGFKDKTLYILDEPTVGLHMADVAKLINVLHKLVDAGNTVVVVEHNVDLWAAADWLIDLGPEGGDSGGSLVAIGPPSHLITDFDTHTTRELAEHLKKR